MPKPRREGEADTRGATDFIESLDRGLRVLELFGGGQQPMTLSDLAKAADLPRATARRILFTLERAGFVASDGKLFRLTPRVLVLASAYLASNHVVSVLQPALDKLSADAQEISSMAILDGHDAVFIARASPTSVCCRRCTCSEARLASSSRGARPKTRCAQANPGCGRCSSRRSTPW